MTSEQIQILLAVLAFLFGVITKFIFDVWDERRKKQTLTFTKKTLNSFSISMLGEQLTERTQLYFSGEPVKSIQIAELEVENTGARAVKNQAVTVRFDEKARILGVPMNKSNSEDGRFVHEENVPGKPNVYRFNIQLLQKDHRLVWEFAVVDNSSGNFVVEHGISTLSKDLTDVDLDVSSVISSSKMQLDLITRMKRILVAIIGIIAIIFIKEVTTFIKINQITIALNVVAISLLIFLLQNLVNVVAPLLGNSRRREEGSRAELINDFETVDTSGGHFVGRDLINYIHPYFREISQEMAQKIEEIYNQIDLLPTINSDDKGVLTSTVREIVEEIQRGDLANIQSLEASLNLLAKKSIRIYDIFSAAVSIDIKNMPRPIRRVIEQVDKAIKGKQNEGSNP